MRSGEAAYRPAGVRTEWLDGFDLPDEAWVSFGIPIGLGVIAFTVLITGLYVRRANNEYDALTAQIAAGVQR